MGRTLKVAQDVDIRDLNISVRDVGRSRIVVLYVNVKTGNFTKAGASYKRREKRLVCESNVCRMGGTESTVAMFSLEERMVQWDVAVVHVNSVAKDCLSY